MTGENDSRGRFEPADPPADSVSPERRAFLVKLSLALTGFAGALVTIPVIGVLFAPLLRRPADVWRSVGNVADFGVGDTVRVIYADPEPLPWAGFTAEAAAYVRRLDDTTIVVFSIYCTHTGCPVEWVESTRLFFCPCHGGAFNEDGTVAAGPPPRPLEQHEVRVRNDQLQIRTRRVPLPPRGA